MQLQHLLLFDPSPAEQPQHPAPSSIPRFANSLGLMLHMWKGRRIWERQCGRLVQGLSGAFSSTFGGSCVMLMV